MYQLRHRNGYDYITCKNYNHAVRELYRQWRDLDGSIPWRVTFNGEDI
jgi:hypothetical protein